MKWSKKYLHTLLRFGIKSGNDWDDVNDGDIPDENNVEDIVEACEKYPLCSGFPWEAFTQESYDKLQNEWGKVWVAINEKGWGWHYNCMEIDEIKRVEYNNTHTTNIQIARINPPLGDF